MMKSRLMTLVVVAFCAVMLSGCGGSSSSTTGDVTTRTMTDSEKEAFQQVSGLSSGQRN